MAGVPVISLDEARANIGRRVTYRSAGGDKVEHGAITSANGWYVFVRYDGSQYDHGIATRGSDLEWAPAAAGQDVEPKSAE